MKVEQTWKFQITTDERVALEKVHDMTLNYIRSDEYKTLPLGIRETIDYLHTYTVDVLEDAEEI